MIKEWIVADGNLDYQNSEEGREIYFKFKEKLKELGITVKRFDHDPNCDH